MNYTAEDIEILEDWWVKKSRVNFLAYRQFMRNEKFTHNWFISDLCSKLQQFYVDLKAGKRPILLIQSPPQHGKSWAITDFIAWISGKNPELRSIYATYSETLGKRCNLAQQRQIDSPKYAKIFPDTKISTKRGEAIRTTNHLEFVDKDGQATGGQFRNTTTNGPVTGETLDLGVIDDAVKGREQANSIAMSQKTWDWFTDDFSTRFSDQAGLLIIMTRWTTHDIIARLIEHTPKSELNVVNYQAIAEKDETHRNAGEALFPDLKTLEFLKKQKAKMSAQSWDSLYQGNPTISGGNMFKDAWWGWWKVLPQIKYKFITADTAQKVRKKNDWTDFKCWGYGVDDNIYLLDHLREKMEAPTLRKEAELFYKKHNIPRVNLTDATLRGMYIEDKSSGIGLIQELRAKRLKIYEIPRNADKIFRAEDAAPYIESGRVYLNVDVPDVDNTTKEARQFPNGEFDDDIDNVMTAIEVAFINKQVSNSLQAAMEAD